MYLTVEQNYNDILVLESEGLNIIKHYMNRKENSDHYCAQNFFECKFSFHHLLKNMMDLFFEKWEPWLENLNNSNNQTLGPEVCH